MVELVYPYLRASTESAMFGAWELRAEDVWMPLPSAMPEAELGAVLTLKRRVRIDRAALLSSTGLGLEDSIVLAVSWRSSSSGLGDAALRLIVDDDLEEDLVVEIDADVVGGRLNIDTALVLATPRTHPSPIIASKPGSVLAADRSTLRVNTSDQMFPVARVDFASTPFDPYASWRLSVTSDLEAPVMGGMVLYVNERDTELAHAIERAPTQSRASLILDTLEAGLTSLIFELAVLHRNEVLERAAWAEGSVGELLHSMLRIAESNGLPLASASADDLSELRSRMEGLVRAIGRGRVFK